MIARLTWTCLAAALAAPAVHAALPPQAAPTFEELTPEEEAQRIKDGWKKQDLTWIPKGETENLERGMWKCGQYWYANEPANEYHSNPETPWMIPGERTILFTTHTRENAERALEFLEAGYADLERFYGIAPEKKPIVMVLTSQEQYAAFNGGDLEKGEMGKSMFGHDKLHGAYYADNWWTEDGEPRRAGVAFWNPYDDSIAAFGPLWIRHALAQAYAGMLDRSTEALEARREKIEKGEDVANDFAWGQAYWEEKALPPWIRYGAAAYVERYYLDESEHNGGDPEWARKWTVDNIKNGGGLTAFDRMLETAPSIARQDESAKWIKEIGLPIWYVLEGGEKKVVAAHEKFQKAFGAYCEKPGKGTRKGLEKALEGLAKVIEKNEKKMRDFAGF